MEPTRTPPPNVVADQPVSVAPQAQVGMSADEFTAILAELEQSLGSYRKTYPSEQRPDVQVAAEPTPILNPLARLGEEQTSRRVINPLMAASPTAEQPEPLLTVQPTERAPVVKTPHGFRDKSSGQWAETPASKKRGNPLARR